MRASGLDVRATAIFLDPDGSSSPETLENVSKFFESCPEEVELATYPIVSIRDGKRQRLHHRYDVLRETGVDDLTLPENATIAQATMNVAVRNRFDGNVLFDFAPANGVIVHEDERVLHRRNAPAQHAAGASAPKRNTGGCAATQGASTALRQPERLYDNNIALFEDFFGRYGNEVPPYIQGLLVYDLSVEAEGGHRAARAFGRRGLR